MRKCAPRPAPHKRTGKSFWPLAILEQSSMEANRVGGLELGGGILVLPPV